MSQTQVAKKPSNTYCKYHYDLIREAVMRIKQRRLDAVKAFKTRTKPSQMVFHKEAMTKEVLEKIKSLTDRRLYPYKNTPKIHTIYRRIEEMAEQGDFLLSVEPKGRGLYKLNPELFDHSDCVDCERRK